MMTTPGLVMRFVVLAAIAQPVLAQTTAALTFDAVSIKPNKSGSGSTSIHTDNDFYRATNLSLKSILQYAYDLQTQDQVIGLPGWSNSVNFDVEAKMDAETVTMLKAASKDEDAHLRQAMMQAM